LKKTYSVLFVCLGNTCRSPLAEVILKSDLRRAVLKKVNVSSAGTGAFEGARASSGSSITARQMGLSLAGFRSKPLTRLRVRRADLILTMTESQKLEVRERWPEDADKVFTLSEYSGSGEGDVRDPVGGPLTSYYRTGDRLRAEIKRIVPRIRKAAKPRS
jgi:protein-tyrosine-phosphatase